MSDLSINVTAMTGSRRTPAARQRRDTLILDLFLSGQTQRSIAADPRVGLTAPRVHQIIRAEVGRASQAQIERYITQLEGSYARGGETQLSRPARLLEVASRSIDVWTGRQLERLEAKKKAARRR